MKELDQYLNVYIVVQLVAFAFLLATWKSTRLGRLLFVLLFLYAGCYNLYIGLYTPDTYLEFANLALPFYRRFIQGWFSHYNHIIIPLIAIGQLLIAAGMLLKGWWVKWACIGATIFLVAIIPLMVGSGFPFSVIVSIAALLILKLDAKEYLWRGLKTGGLQTGHQG